MTHYIMFDPMQSVAQLKNILEHINNVDGSRYLHRQPYKYYLKASPTLLPKLDYLNICVGRHLFLYYLYFASNSNSTA
jgi:hypothetical protein